MNNELITQVYMYLLPIKMTTNYKAYPGTLMHFDHEVSVLNSIQYMY